MTQHSPTEIKQFVTDCRIEEAKKRTFSTLEENLWDMAEVSHFEQTRIITTNQKVLADPYLMRVYLTPEREKLEEQLVGLGVPSAYATYMRHMPRPYLHYFFRGDDDRAFHNHPWERSFSFIILGGFIEHVWNFELKRALSRFHAPGTIYQLKRGTYHRAELLPGKNCWTLFMSMGRVQAKDGHDWNFYDPHTDSYTPWGLWTAAQAAARDFEGHRISNLAKVDDKFAVLRDDLPPAASGLGSDPHAGHGGYNWSALR